ncbi:hypothetical protein M409DRAFT_71161 [Zasmidium cellare ATCC 36951]|uniref:PXA domain-containing protein n=1 Tax=Zasmidium cellare ATCC 36951 TaxID=1080233 RepID=A0A6A6BX46_ZASCE|nr:uncharacterized protein M409DRAFT_71161 [Zasmidium cellare ATCC 36951]KAF2159275.1 hypothetical protein M409DRAFT_71161 [Zasmidium cellare ATCC 36951]
MAQSGPRLATRAQSRVSSRDEATIAYIKKILCSRPPTAGTDPDVPTRKIEDSSLEELLPPLTSSNEVDIQLYALIAVILSNFVQTWYNRITPDQQFVSEIVQIIAHCTRGLEQRLRKVDLEGLLLDEVPDLLATHVRAIKTCRASRTGSPTAREVQLRYHALNPHVALEPLPLDDDTAHRQSENETAWCLLLVNRVLPLLLPPEDLQNPCLDVLVSEVFAELIFRNGICGKACEPWLIWDGVAKLLRSLRSVKGTLPKNSSVPLNRLDEYGLLAASRASEDPLPHGRPRRRFDALSHTFWFTMQCVITAWVLLRACFIALMQAGTLPARSSRNPSKSKASEGVPVTTNTISGLVETPSATKAKRPIVDMHIWGCISEVLSLDQRMPWLSGILSLVQRLSLQGPGQLCQTNSRLDRLMSSTIHQRLLAAAPDWLPPVLQAARSALFPDNVLAAGRAQPPSSDEVVEIKRECARAIVEAMMPDVVGAAFFATKDHDLMREDVEAQVLDLLADAYVNKHLVVLAVELIVVRLFPELGSIAAGR